MDIFTTQLTRVVPVPIKPASLKVKALLKEAANSKLSQDPDHLENHEYYFTKEDEYHSEQQEAKRDTKEDQHDQEENVNTDPESNANEELAQKPTESGEKTASKNDKPKHLDLYV
jgi:hypothetical protein